MVVSSYHTTYAPFGSVLTTTGTGQRTGYIGREADNETGLGNYGVRLYEPEYGRFMSVDVLWEKRAYANPYHYCLNMPLTSTDASGLDLIILVDKEGAHSLGHVAVLIGNDNTGWDYFSLDGSKGWNPLHGPAKVDPPLSFTTLSEFVDKGRKEKQLERYDIAYRIAADKLTDEKFRSGAQSETDKSKDYDIFTHSCIDVVSGTLEAAGYWGGNRRTNIPLIRINQILNSLHKAGVTVDTLNPKKKAQGDTKSGDSSDVKEESFQIISAH
ncbi:MAG: hypothetical protein F9K28_11455 [Bacteroidetes bacterium]|nr:MAG: hypothetical protein F9K28_11455 [Bacteroidota bacterium]MBZ0194580.1 hypothetical protein [Candidatus Kapabacteria bacterium]